MVFEWRPEARRSHCGVCRNMPTTWDRNSGTRTGWSLLSLLSLPSWEEKMLEPLHPMCASTSLCRVCSESPSPLPGKPFCESSVGISGQPSHPFFPRSEMFPRLIHSISACFPQTFPNPSCCVPLGQSPPCAPLSNHAPRSQNLHFCEIS